MKIVYTESQAFMWKYVCWPCRMPSFLLKGTGIARIGSKSPPNPLQFGVKFYQNSHLIPKNKSDPAFTY